MSTVRPPIDLSPDDRAALTMMLRHSFPDAEIDEAMLEAVALAGFLDESSGVRLDWDRYRGPLETHAAALELSRGNGSSLRLRTRASEQQQQQQPRYYKVHATHNRERPDYDPFTGHVGMVRVSLPRERPRTIATPVGDVEADDHLLATVAEVEHKYGAKIDGEITRVDLITPARRHGGRFAAVSVYLGFTTRASDRPSFYVLEAGLATGQPKVLYFAPNFEHRLVSYSGYRPTPFSDVRHVYTARLTPLGDNPLLLQIRAHRDESSPPYMCIHAVFEETTRPDTTWPTQLLLQAAKIVARRLLDGVKRDEA